jgi:hypothetical protein
MTADRLRQAAQKIRGAADGLPSEWYEPNNYNEWGTVGIDHIALWSPPVALAVADWLDSEAAPSTEPKYRHPEALRVANLILGDAS